MNSSNLKNNEPWIENSRAIATIAVILLHVAADLLYTIGKGPIEIWWIGNIYDGLTRFSVPLFFMISGALLLNKDYELKTFLKKRFVRLVPPLLFWSLVYLVYNNLIYETTVYNVLEFIKTVVRGLLYGSEDHLWFVYEMIGLYLFIPIIRKYINHSTTNEILYFLIIWIITVLAYNPYLHKYFPSVNLLNFTGYMGYMILGYYLTTFTVKKNFLAFLFIFVGAFATIYGTYVESLAINSYSGIYYDYHSINIVVFTLGVFLLLKKTSINNKTARKIIAFISDHSFGVYLGHILVLQILNRNGLDWTIASPWLTIPFITICCLIVSLVIVYLLRLIKFGKYISG